MRPQKVGKVLVEKETITIEQNLRVIRDSKRGKKVQVGGSGGFNGDCLS